MMSYTKLDSKSLPNSNDSINNNDIKHLISTQPNSTILASNYPSNFSESDLFSLFSHYGHVQKVQKLLNINCCMIEFSDITIAKALVQMSRCNKFILGSYQVGLEYSLKKIGANNTSGNVIIIIISNVKYPITVDIIKQICQKFGKIVRIHIGKKNVNNVMESLVEFEQSSEARAAKEGLNGEDIYSGCCSLEIKFSTISCVTVLKNDDKSWDFTMPQSKQGILQPPLQNFVNTMPLKQEPTFNSNLPIWPLSNIPPPMIPPYNPPMTQMPPFPFPPVDPSLSFPYHIPLNKVKLDISRDAFIVEKGAVFMCYHVPFNMSVDHLFNLFCLYGNVSKIRFLLNHLHAVMVQMGSKKAADLCIRHFNGKTLFGKEIKLSPCVKLEVFVPKKVDFLPNGTSSFKDFSKDPNNRFLNDLAVSTNKIYDPNRTLHFFNAPCTFREFDLTNMLIQSGVPKPMNIIIFNTKNDKIRKCIGLFEFHRVDDALVALSVLNHKPIIIPETNQMFHLKLTFSAREPNKIGSNKGHPKRSYDDDDGDHYGEDKMIRLDEGEERHSNDRSGFLFSDDEFEDGQCSFEKSQNDAEKESQGHEDVVTEIDLHKGREYDVVLACSLDRVGTSQGLKAVEKPLETKENISLEVVLNDEDSKCATIVEKSSQIGNKVKLEESIDNSMNSDTAITSTNMSNLLNNVFEIAMEGSNANGSLEEFKIDHVIKSPLEELKVETALKGYKCERTIEGSKCDGVIEGALDDSKVEAALKECKVEGASEVCKVDNIMECPNIDGVSDHVKMAVGDISIVDDGVITEYPDQHTDQHTHQQSE